MKLIQQWWQDLRSEPIPTIARWQDSRFLWLLMAGMSLFMVILAHSVFQKWLYMKPCEQCVYIRFAFFAMVIGGFVAAINPKNAVLKVIGYVFAIYGSVKGLLWSLKLNKIHHVAHSDDPFGVQGCSTDPSFPFGLPLAEWSPEWFKPTGDCGFDNPIVPDGAVLSSMQQWLVDFYRDGWYLWPPSHFMNMAQCTVITFGVILLVLIICAAAWIIHSIRGKKAGV
ncbi:protein-disulfide oxidoreductase DsbI [Desulfuromonas sp. AOP6]|uniref:protein-disulfide oxidoreductase DsbI n=1 Tax=Desulfuromonas sp. AOP6 TaxID=1566351 RepID=UPI00127FF17B|nr:protein-disulfide oxidoreductase DsbI [Desulfuromonas sp. AOP6]BCA80841.1 protein-disulfide oxidoreductase DsbI [Desulfuromonas sp. AOP6]